MAKKLSLLNKKQRKWLNNFLEGKPYARLTNVYDSLDGDRVVEIVWWEHSTPTVIDSHTLIQGSISYKVRIKLRKFGDPRKTANFSYEITPAQKKPYPTDSKNSYHLNFHKAT